MKTLIRALVVTLAASTLAAQTPTGKRSYPLGLESALAGLGLSATQQAQVDSISDQYWLKMSAMSGKLNGAPRDEQRKAAEDTRAHLNADVERVLSKPQLETFHKNIEARAKARAGAAPPR